MIYQNTWASLLKFCQTVTTKYSLGATVLDFEAHASIEELPIMDLMGPSSLGMSQDPIDYASFAIAYSSIGEEGLFRHRKAIDALYFELALEKLIPLYDLDAPNTLIGNLIIDEGTLVAPMTRAGARPFQFVQAVGRVVLN